MLPSLIRRQATNVLSRIPQQRGPIQSPVQFLNAIGRDSADKLGNVASNWTWEEMWSVKADTLKNAGVTVKDRKYLLWAMQKYREGGEPTSFAIPLKPKKKVRGWGPRVQNGKRVHVRR
ncbi:Vacuolar fusion protein mon1 [Tulasnella sp. 419]|nr:Vacuolar fusion protein mon1 [Tulasnella sp. 418]KAG8965169.1 Vacuolar fusion protein mon1 [Tulasnella sp. 419]